MASKISDTTSLGYESDHSGGSSTTPDTFAFPDGVVRGVESGVLNLRLSSEGEGGTYFVVTDVPGESPLAVFKPAAEEIGTKANPHGNSTMTKEGFVAGEGYKCEELAFLLDYDNFAGVPETRVVTLRGMCGSLQRFVPSTIESWNTTPGKFRADHVQRIAILDLRLLNCDRHGGNVLVAADRSSLVPIDHSYVLPHGWADPEFEWQQWPQSRLPFGPEELAYIARLDASRDRVLVAAALGEESGDVIFATTKLLQHAAPRGYTPRQLAEFCRRATLTQPSGLEELLAECCDSSWLLDEALVDAFIARRFP